MAAATDKELQIYRDLLKPPEKFEDGFGWSTVGGIVFCGLIMMPGAIYLGLMTGGGIGAAATWVTVILFNEIARRSMKHLSRAQLVVLLHAAGAMVGGGLFGGLVQRAYLVSSDPMRDAGIRGHFPSWFAPSPDSPAILQRDLLHHDWFIPIALLLFLTVIGFIKRYTLGYFFYRLTSDIEHLPFPLAPISAQGTLAMTEADDAPRDEAAAKQNAMELLSPRKATERKKSLRWRLFSLGVVIGILFGAIQTGIPTISSLFLDKPIFFLPQPWLETTTMTQGVLPATPTGIVLDLGIVGLGMVLPFWAVIGSTLAILLTMILNPLLHHFGVLTTWQPGMDTINTSFSASVDFWLSFGIGAGLGIAFVSFYSTFRDVRARLREMKAAAPKDGVKHGSLKDLWATPKLGRGDFPMWIAVAGYVVAASATVGVCYMLLPQNYGILAFLIFFAFIYNPIISYVNARLLGISGQSVDIPFIKESSFILSGAKGVEIWLAPIPIENYGGQAQSFRVNELTGVSLLSLVKTDLVVMPVLFVLSLVFWGFIWSSSPIPSASFPAAQIQWELGAKQSALLFSSTFSPDPSQPTNLVDSEFMKAIHPPVIVAGGVVTIALFASLSALSLPIMLVYGIIRGLGGMPHTMILEVVGALIGRYYIQKKYGQTPTLTNMPTILAGYFTGVGLIAMGTIALKLIVSAISAAPF